LRGPCTSTAPGGLAAPRPRRRRGGRLLALPAVGDGPWGRLKGPSGLAGRRNWGGVARRTSWSVNFRWTELRPGTPIGRASRTNMPAPPATVVAGLPYVHVRCWSGLGFVRGPGRGGCSGTWIPGRLPGPESPRLGAVERLPTTSAGGTDGVFGFSEHPGPPPGAAGFLSNGGPAEVDHGWAVLSQLRRRVGPKGGNASLARPRADREKYKLEPGPVVGVRFGVGGAVV